MGLNAYSSYFCSQRIYMRTIYISSSVCVCVFILSRHCFRNLLICVDAIATLLWENQTCKNLNFARTLGCRWHSWLEELRERRYACGACARSGESERGEHARESSENDCRRKFVTIICEHFKMIYFFYKFGGLAGIKRTSSKVVVDDSEEWSVSWMRENELTTERDIHWVSIRLVYIYRDRKFIAITSKRRWQLSARPLYSGKSA